MRFLGSPPRPSELETLRLRPRIQWFNKPSRWCRCTLKLEVTDFMQSKNLWHIRQFKNNACGEIPGGPVVRTARSHCQGCGFIPWSGSSDLTRSHKMHGATKKKAFRISGFNVPHDLYWAVFLFWICSMNGMTMKCTCSSRLLHTPWESIFQKSETRPFLLGELICCALNQYFPYSWV